MPKPSTHAHPSPTHKHDIRVAIYLRVSLDPELDGLTIDRHREACLQIAQQRKWTVVETYVDQSISATDKSKVRPSYDRMVQDYASGAFEAIICWDLDRLTRQPRQLEDWIEAAEERGLLLVTANGEADLSTDGGRMYARIKAAVARAEVERKGARQSAGQAQRAAQGRAPKGMRPLGYTTSGSVIAHEAAAVKAIYEAFARGCSIRSIAAALSGEQDDSTPAGVPALPRHDRTVALERNERRVTENRSLPPQKQKRIRDVPADRAWPPSTVLGILRNPRYAGYSTYTPKDLPASHDGGSKRRSWRASILMDDAGSPVLGQWEALIAEGPWWDVQNKLDDPERITNRVGTDRKHLGAGLYRCGHINPNTQEECGLPVRTHSGRYRCAGHIVRSLIPVDRFVVHAIMHKLSMREFSDILAQEETPRLQAISATIDQHRGRLARAQHDYDSELIEARDLKRIRTREENAIAALAAERSQLQARNSVGSVLNAPDPSQAFAGADLATRRQVIDWLTTVTLLPYPRGRKAFDESTVRLDWRSV
ncbi:recombinase family protein [Arthrobacter bambusae]|uniref:DNA invertase Pin-like site-specific DNA recombinase n=1 Tax=Arthrobacter bambusae TaxID=1338426 RepID=A0AAW8D9W5_9MICC|nr:recombinase family protein [Arthrobacter bambusae]MDP9903090.1 DNA invertase Pin-like site-specific DNA recombinase [Arthrobacter bambusae]MDQ0128916.1 DNA invertase Pin-like site-specific DNA recombinase [Arthrobacter bambusae]MDQ0180257.1 DNA invertase Pin-like site-specific DNA recombinase [Arthrobacter bambusae]